MPSVTMQDIANAAGVHRTTVSLAMRHHPSIPVETRDRLLGVAERLGYRPNPLVSALMSQLRGKRGSGQHETIAYITAYPLDNPWKRYSSLTEMFEGARVRASRLGFFLEEFDLRAEGMSGPRLGKILRTRGIRGLILAPLPEQTEVVDFDFSPFAAVTLGLSLQKPALERIASDHYQCIRLVLENCRRLGYARPGLVLGQGISTRLEGRWMAGLLYEQYLTDSVRPRPLLVRDEPAWWKNPKIAAWCRREKPDVVVMPLGSVNWREMADLPGKPAVANLSLPSKSGDTAGILQDTFQIGEIGVERVVSRLLHNDIGPLDRIQNTMLHGEWIDGESVPQR